MYVDPTARTSVYVFGGQVGVANVALPDTEVLVGPGEMTVAAPMRRPSAPAAFGSGEFDQLGQYGSLDRAEDPVLEATESPGAESYLAFSDPDIDAVRNPAYLAESPGLRSTTLLSAGGAAGRDWVDNGGGREDAARFSSNAQSGQHVTIAPVGTAP